MSRRDEIAANLVAVQERIGAACAAAGRDQADVTLVVVTKTFPVEDVRHLHALGVRDVGENRDQDAAPKAAACSDLDLRWHFVGQLQTNKARSVTAYAETVHSVDRVRLVTALERGAAEHGRRVGVFVQVDLDPGDAPDRGGARPGEVDAVAEAVEAAGHLDLAGLMAVAPLDAPAAEAFARLQEISARLRATYPHAAGLSAGMSHDLEDAIAHGATHLRVGTAILGSRPPLG
ncbi:MAG: dependent protein [Actinomycetota bacterium]|jgi:pyridoxal phosphate enzyme (YggS family)|nr:dependent protein [Actinomycetota bacterium]